MAVFKPNKTLVRNHKGYECFTTIVKNIILGGRFGEVLSSDYQSL